MRYLLLLVVVLAFSGLANGQVRSDRLRGGEDIGNGNGDNQNAISDGHFNFTPKLFLGVGVGVANMYGDLNTSVPAPVVRIGLGTRLTPSLLVGLEAYGGQLSSKQTAVLWTSGMKSTSTFESIDAHIKVDMSSFIENPYNNLLKFVSHIYIGTGYGFVHVSNSFTGTFAEYTGYKIKDFTKADELSGYVPLNLGFRIPLNLLFGSSSSSFMVNYQINYTFSDFIDGYSPPSASAENRSRDAYTVLTMGFSFRLSKE
jgi:hypothetical protein